MTPRVREVLSWYGADNIGVLTNLARILNHGRLRGTGKMVLLPVEGGITEGPAQSFARNPDGYDPSYHLELALESGCNAHAAPLGALQSCSRDYAGEIPLLLKIQPTIASLAGSETTASLSSAASLGTGLSGGFASGSVAEALRLGCVGIALTLFPQGSMTPKYLETLVTLSEQSRAAGLVVMLSFRGTSNSGPIGESLPPTLDQVAQGAHWAVQLGAHIISVPIPSSSLTDEVTQKIYFDRGIKTDSLVDRARHILHAAFNGRRLVLFEEGDVRGSKDLLKEINDLARGGAFGCVMGKNAFQRPKGEAIPLLNEVMDAFGGYNTGRNLR